MSKLEYAFTNDTLFKMLFVKYPELLKKLVAALLHMNIESIHRFVIKNPEMPPDIVGGKFCRLDINMEVDEEIIDLEVQVGDQGDYAARSLYYWAREYSLALSEGEAYKSLPRTVVISILGFKQFECQEYHSEYRALEVSRHTLLTDKMELHYFELLKLPEEFTVEDERLQWLKLFGAETEEDLQKIKEMGVEAMQEAIEAYREVSATAEFRELERQRERARHNEASALLHAETVAKAEEREKWQAVVAEKDATHSAEMAEKDAELARLRALLEKKPV